MARRRPQARPYDRTERISEAIRVIVATELERIGDESIEMVTVTGVRVAKDLATAEVFYSSMTAEADGRAHTVVDGLELARKRIQRVVNNEIRLRKTPQIVFKPDDVLLAALHIEDLIEGRVEPAGD